ncbi:MAG: hypothetical protein EAZ32_18420 [Cytophagia bacterium]|nr:MAG: hypothetical protein EAZ46_12115 [Runella sp.]TAG24455.1 MAG: hypothetical protein EAZ38_01155 [Cytophagales bacterium]TAG35390.1 MAG: hypothetical protein EAZ32_18420 [Cytophagia bacterium]TAG77167.1 MAG: hypothetical protein EAZ22_16225 [Cytophagales bacterium]
MITKKKCITCGTEFEAKRSNSMYCSNACKQKAHTQRVVHKVNEPEPKPMAVKEFSISDYEAFLSFFNCDVSEFPFEYYCFCIRSASSDMSKESRYKLADFINKKSFLDTDAIKTFYEDFGSGKFNIVN